MLIGKFDTELIKNSSIRDYFEEVLASYMSEHNRSAIVLLYSTVITDVMQKLKELSEDFGDAKAAAILTKVHAKQTANPTDPSWENDVVEDILKQGIVTTAVAGKIDYLQKQRHLCAHPVLNVDYELEKPSNETVIDFISYMYENLLTRPAPFLGNVVDKMTNALAKYNTSFSNNSEAIEREIVDSYLKRCEKKDFERIYKAYWKFVFQDSSDPTLILYKELNYFTIKVLTKNAHHLCTDIFKSGRIFDTTSTSDGTMFRLTSFFEDFYDLYQYIPGTWKGVVDAFLDRSPNSRLLCWYRTSPEGHIDYLINNPFIPFSTLITKETYDKFYLFYKQMGSSSKAHEFFIKHLSKASSFESAYTIFCNAVMSHLPLFGQQQYTLLLNTMNDNDQVYHKSNYNRDNMINTVCSEYEKKFGQKLILTSYANLQ